MTNLQRGWEERDREGRWPCRGRQKAADANGVVQPSFPWGQEAEGLRWPSSSSFPHPHSHCCFHAVTMATQVFDWLLSDGSRNDSGNEY